MIIDFIVQGFFGIFTTLFSVFPDIPAMPTVITNGWNWFIDMTNSVTGLLVYFLSPPLYIMAISLIIFMFAFNWIYHLFIRFIIFKVAMRFFAK